MSARRDPERTSQRGKEQPHNLCGDAVTPSQSPPRSHLRSHQSDERHRQHDEHAEVVRVCESRQNNSIDLSIAIGDEGAAEVSARDDLTHGDERSQVPRCHPPVEVPVPRSVGSMRPQDWWMQAQRTGGSVPPAHLRSDPRPTPVRRWPSRRGSSAARPTILGVGATTDGPNVATKSTGTTSLNG